ncbi:helix-turn-helix transcriptional regulator [Trujillonella endophytica]|uniref:helix-turn-helix transcriptional regulator n=1 Tax=Trujillonella endophytica TaxID=673521 RepID=UPI00147CF5AC|nr:WYL domain-containing protein [Trujillella endophytica]
MSRRTEPRHSATLPPVALTPEEAAAVAVALAAGPDGPYADAGRGALEKVLAVLEPDPQRRAQLLATSLWVSAEAGRSAELRATVERAVTQRRVVVLHYRDGKGRAGRREVEPQLLTRSSDHWYLVAWCRERQAPRWFREDRIESVELTGEAAPRRDPGIFGAPSTTHPAGRALGRGATARVPAAREPVAETLPPRLRVLQGGREG